MRAQHSKWQKWERHILVGMIVLQACFMAFWGIRNPLDLIDPRENPINSVNNIGAGLQSNKQEWSVAGGSDEENPENAVGQGAVSDELVALQQKQRQQQEMLFRKKFRKETPVTTPPQYKSNVQKDKNWEVNLGHFPGALHFHFAREQEEPSFRNKLSKDEPKNWALSEQHVSSLLKGNPKVQSCQSYGKSTDNTWRNLQLDSCLNMTINKDHKGLVTYNSQSFPRTWCGKTMEPLSAQQYSKNEICEEPVRLLLKADKLLGTKGRELKAAADTIVFKRKESTADDEEVVGCDVPCQFTMDKCTSTDGKEQKGPACLPEVSEWTVEGTDFHFVYSTIDPWYRKELTISKKAYRQHQFYATRSLASEVPLPEFDFERYGLRISPANDYEESRKNGVVWIHIEPCQGGIRVDGWASKVKEGFGGKFDHFSTCHPKKLAPDNLDLANQDDIRTLMSRYMFVLIFGTSLTPDILSDMVWEALQAGSIPVYYGAPNVRHLVPVGSFVDVAIHGRDGTGAYLKEVAESKDSWSSYHAWRDDETAFTQFVTETYGFLKGAAASSYCRMCRWAYATKYALGWDHKSQTLQRPAMDRTLCVSKKDVGKFPFQELWMSNMGAQDTPGKKFCDKTSTTQTIDFDGVAITRTVTQHDNGVIDIIITDVLSTADDAMILLRLNFQDAVHNLHGASLLHPHQVMATEENASANIPMTSSIAIQDETTRVTVLANWVTKLSTPTTEGKIDLVVLEPNHAGNHEKHLGEDGEPVYARRLLDNEILRIRVIMEDVNGLRDVSSEYSVSPYARLMIQDFLEPVELYLATQ